ncbi:MAG: hypothetical protein RR585_01930 [Coprobacillus sp.]
MNDRVLVIGLRIEQARKLKDLYKDLNIEYNSDPAKHTAKLTNLEAYKKIIVCTKFTTHKTHNMCKKHSGYTMTAGGFSSVRLLLQEMGAHYA